MPKPQTLTTSAREFFSQELKSVLEKQHVRTHAASFEYLIDLLLRFVETEQFFHKDEEGKLQHHLLAHLYQQGIQGDQETLKRLGDISLFVTGFFPDSLNRKTVDIDYYQQMGGSAYQHLSQLQLTMTARTLFKELSEKFKNFSEALNELSERSGLQNNSDLLRLYEKWLATGSKRWEKLLAEKGLNPIIIDPKIKH